MNIDDYLNELQSSLENQFSEFDTSSPTFIYCPECGTKLKSDANFCTNCGYAFNKNPDTEEAYSNSNDIQGNTKEGIIFTDTSVLAKKYRTQTDVVKLWLSRFITASHLTKMRWHLLDVAEHQLELGEGTWMDYSEIIQRFCNNNNIATGPRLSLFIIGGNDVIPQPCEYNPAHCPSPWRDDEYSERLYADFFYCYYGQLKLDYLDYNKARCNVGRLPLDTGTMNTTIEEDLGKYFKQNITINCEGGIPIGYAVMTSNREWIPASREMSRNLPTESMTNNEDAVLDNMYISPAITADMDDRLRARYYSSLSKADMLVFNLHGSCHPQMSGFYSNKLAFSTDMLCESNARIFNTVACWGGRYIKYTREQSMLLNAIHNGSVMLYCGACVPALGKCGNYQEDSTWRIQPAAYSETLMARFAEYQCMGTMSAGEAMLKAKCDYYNTSRMIEEDEFTLATVLMFNLYGNPMLETVPNMQVISQLQHENGLKEFRIPFRQMKREIAMKEGEAVSQTSANGSILDAVRTAVDTTLSKIHDGIVRNLYERLGVEPRELFSVERYTSSDAEGNPCSGYLYNYARENNMIRIRIRVKVDEKGNILDAVQTK